MGPVEGKCISRKGNVFLVYKESHAYIAVLGFYCHTRNCNKQWLKTTRRVYPSSLLNSALYNTQCDPIMGVAFHHLCHMLLLRNKSEVLRPF